MFLSVITLLVCLLLSLVNVTGAWFTDSSGTNKTINAIVKTGEANLNVYQEDRAGTQTIISKAVPTGYTQVEYLQSSSTQFIESGVTPSADFGFELDMQLLNTTADQKFFGSYDNGVFLGTLSGKWRFGYSCNVNEVATTLNRTVVTLKDGVWLFNGTAATTTQAPHVNSWPITIFGVNYQGNPKYGMAPIKLYGLKLYKGGKLIKNYVPAVSSSGVYGLYETVDGEFKTNSGTGVFAAGQKISTDVNISLAYDTTNKTNNKLILDTLPTGYTQLDYLEATGKQYIDTGYIPNADSKFDVTFLVNDANLNVDCPLFGARNNWENSYTFWCHGEGYSAASQVIFNGKGSSLGNFKLNVKHRLTVQNGSYTLNGTTTTFASVSSGSPANTNLILMGLNNGGTSVDSRRFVGYVYSFKIYDNNVIVRNLVPARNSAGVLGMYDTVGNQFYTNKGTGNFIAGESSNQLKLLLKNEDLGKSFGVRYKVEFFVATATGKKALSATIAGMTAPTSSTNGFKLNSDGWYYYQNNSGVNVVFEPATSSAVTSKYLMTSFTIKSDATTDALLGGNAIYMQITVESITV